MRAAMTFGVRPDTLTLTIATVFVVVAATLTVPGHAMWGPLACFRAFEALVFSHNEIPGVRNEAALKALETGTPAQREYARQLRRLGAVWAELKEPLRAELESFERLGRTDRQAYLQRVSESLLAALQVRYGVRNIGLHFNMHGGRPIDYVDAGGIRAGTPTLPMLNHRDHVDLNRERTSEVYFFQTDRQSLHDALGTPHQDNVLFPFLRMGDSIILFRLDNLLNEGVQNGQVIRHGLQFLRFDPRHVPEGGIGIPQSEFLAPPIPLFHSIPARIGRYDLSWDGETLSALRALERLLL